MRNYTASEGYVGILLQGLWLSIHGLHCCTTLSPPWPKPTKMFLFRKKLRAAVRNRLKQMGHGVKSTLGLLEHKGTTLVFLWVYSFNKYRLDLPPFQALLGRGSQRSAKGNTKQLRTAQCHLRLTNHWVYESSASFHTPPARTLPDVFHGPDRILPETGIAKVPFHWKGLGKAGGDIYHPFLMCLDCCGVPLVKVLSHAGTAVV